MDIKECLPNEPGRCQNATLIERLQIELEQDCKPRLLQALALAEEWKERTKQAEAENARLHQALYDAGSENADLKAESARLRDDLATLAAKWHIEIQQAEETGGALGKVGAAVTKAHRDELIELMAKDRQP